jgi:hypothetical protein
MNKSLKMLVFVLMLMVVSISFGQTVVGELSADTPAVEMTTIETAWLWVSRIFWGVMAWVGIMFSKYASVVVPKVVEVLTVFLKSWNHWRGASVVIDTGMEIVSESGYDLAKKLDDGKLTDDEKRALLAEIKNRSVAKLKNLAGFYKKDLEAWAQEQAGVFLGKLLYRGSSSSGLKTLS